MRKRDGSHVSYRSAVALITIDDAPLHKKKMGTRCTGYRYPIRITGQVFLTAPASLVSAVTSGALHRIDAATKSAS